MTDDLTFQNCPVCGACGEDGCCPKSKCTRAQGCKYGHVYYPTLSYRLWRFARTWRCYLPRPFRPMSARELDGLLRRMRAIETPAPDDPLASARDCWNGLLICAALWVLIAGALWIVARAIW